MKCWFNLCVHVRVFFNVLPLSSALLLSGFGDWHDDDDDDSGQQQHQSWIARDGGRGKGINQSATMGSSCFAHTSRPRSSSFSSSSSSHSGSGNFEP